MDVQAAPYFHWSVYLPADNELDLSNKVYIIGTATSLPARWVGPHYHTRDIRVVPALPQTVPFWVIVETAAWTQQ